MWQKQGEDQIVDEAEKIIAKIKAMDDGSRLKLSYAGLYRDGHAGGPYDYQKLFHDLGADNRERALLAANQVGKTLVCAAELAIHATGQYPKWWAGRRYDKPVEILVCGESNESVRNVQQKALFGPMADEGSPSGTGWVPADCIGDLGLRQCGLKGVLDYVKVKHVSGGWSQFMLKSYEQGASKFQGMTYDIAWADEEPTPNDGDIFSELRRGLMVKRGMLMLSRTPLYGMTDIIRYFVNGGPGVAVVRASWDDAPHMTPEMREEELRKYPEHERNTRSKGDVLMGSSGVYNVPDEVIACDPFEIPSYYRRICGIDFGIDHPGAAVWLAHDADTDNFFVYDCYRARGETAAYHAQAIKERGSWIPVSWPHDGMIRDKGSGIHLKNLFAQHGVNLLPFSARYLDDKGSGQGTEPVVDVILQAMRTGRFKVFRHLKEWFEEKRMYHRKDGFIVKKNDDLLAATHYAVMMRRFATGESSVNAARQENVEAFDPLADFMRA